MNKNNAINLPEIVMNATIEDFKSYLNHFNKTEHVRCSTCNSHEWEINASPKDKDKPVIVTLPIPFVNGAGVWSFFLMCSRCGEMKFINTNKVAEWLYKTKS